MSDEKTLLPCPFCGGEAELKLYQNGDWQIICYHADGCIMRESDLSDCYWESVQTLARQWNTRADYHGYEHAAIEAWESIKAWNTRAELGSGTCEKVYAVGGIIAQAECRDVCSDVEQFTCSACGFNCDLTSWITPIGCERPIVHHHHGTPNYCPNCGRKVVSA